MRNFITAIGTMVLLSAAAFAGGSQEGATSSSDSRPVEIRYATWGKEPYIQATVEGFESTHPGITVVVESIPGKDYWVKMEAAALSNTLPEIIRFKTSEIGTYIEGGFLTDLTNLSEFDPSFSYDNFPKVIVDKFTFDGKIYGVPKDFDTIALFYNKEIFDEAGESYPNKTWDWQTLVEVAKRLTDANAGVYGFAAPITGQKGYWNTILQAGGYVITPDGRPGFDLAGTKQGLQFWYDLLNTHGVSPTPAQMEETKPDTMFLSGKIAMMYNGSWMIDNYMMDNEAFAGKFDLAVLPQGPVRRATISNSLCFSVSSGIPTAAGEEAAFHLASYLGSMEAQTIEAEYGGAIPAFMGAEEKWKDVYAAYNVDVFFDSLAWSFEYPVTRLSSWKDELNTMVKRMLSGDVDIDSGCAELQRSMEALIAEEAVQ